tara:strand:+ start:20317 stop:21003 length:687 start_codon:yes stop_codon:yes gene_type:complete
MSQIDTITPNTAARSTSSGGKPSVSSKEGAALFASIVKAPKVEDRPEEPSTEVQDKKQPSTKETQHSNQDKKEDPKQLAAAPEVFNPFTTKVESPPPVLSTDLHSLATELMAKIQGLQGANPTALVTLSHPQLMGEVKVSIMTEGLTKTLNVDFALDPKSLNFLNAAAQSDLKAHLLHNLKQDGFTEIQINAKDMLAQGDSEGNPQQQGENVDLFKAIREEAESYAKT